MVSSICSVTSPPSHFFLPVGTFQLYSWVYRCCLFEFSQTHGLKRGCNTNCGKRRGSDWCLKISYLRPSQITGDVHQHFVFYAAHEKFTNPKHTNSFCQWHSEICERVAVQKRVGHLFLQQFFFFFSVKCIQKKNGVVLQYHFPVFLTNFKFGWKHGHVLCDIRVCGGNHQKMRSVTGNHCSHKE